MDRRRFLATVLTAAPLCAVPRLAAAAARDARVIHLSHLHTAERLSIEYCTGGQYVPGALDTVNHLLRDFRTGDVHPIDPKLLDLLHALAHAVDTRRPFEVISGYRSPTTNQMLRAHSGGVASGSLHMRGQAIDIRVGDVPLAALRAAARRLALGGVGYYPSSNFLHVDTGRVRSW